MSQKNSSESNNDSMQQHAPLPSSEPPEEEEYVIVKYDYEHKPKDGKKGQPYSIKQGDKLRLIERTNDEWWKLKPEGSKKAIYVPATYVEICSSNEVTSTETELDTYANTEFMQGQPAQAPLPSAPKEEMQQYANSELFKNPTSSDGPHFSGSATVIGLSHSRPQQQQAMEPDVPLACTLSGPGSIPSTPQPQPQPHSQTSLLSKAIAHAAAASSIARAQSLDLAAETVSKPIGATGSSTAFEAPLVLKGARGLPDDDVPTAAPSTTTAVTSAARPDSTNTTTTITANLNTRSLARSTQPPQYEQTTIPTTSIGPNSSLSKGTGAPIAAAAVSAASDARLTEINVPSTPTASSSSRHDDFSTTLPLQSTLVGKATHMEVPVDIPVVPTPVNQVQHEGFLSFTPLKPDNKLSKSKVLVGFASLRGEHCNVYKDEKAAMLAKHAASAQPSSKSKVPEPLLSLDLRDSQLVWNPDTSLSKRTYFTFGRPMSDKRFLIQLPDGLKSSGPRFNSTSDDLRQWFNSFERAKREMSDTGAASARKPLSGSREDLVSASGATSAPTRSLGGPSAAVVGAGGMSAVPVLRHDSSAAGGSVRIRRDERPASLVQAGPTASTGFINPPTRPSIATGAAAAAAAANTAGSPDSAAPDKKGKASTKKEEEKARKELEKVEKEKGNIFERLTKFFAKRPTPMDIEKRGLIHDMVFGSTLIKVCENDRTLVPIFVTNCIAEVERRGLDIDGVYRISANLSQVQKLRHTVDQSAGKCNLAEWDVHVITGAMKLFFRELKDPIIDSHTLERIYAVQTHQKQSSEKFFNISKEISQLPRCHSETLRALILHCRKVADCHDQNRMLASNLAIVFGPTLAAPIQSGTRRLDLTAASGSTSSGGGSVKGPQKKRLPAGAAAGGHVQIGGPLPGPAPEQQQGDPFISSAMYLGVIFEFLVVNSDSVFGSSL